MMHLAIAGNIGSGKTTLTRLLAKHYDLIPEFEDTEENPYLNDFYQDMHRWSFNLQIYFLNSRFRQIQDIKNQQKRVVQDRTIYEDACIFAPNLHEMGLMTERDFSNYQSLFGIMQSFLNPPDLLIYLRASIPTLIKQIQKRGRDYENSIRIDYLTKLNEKYESWIQTYDKGRLLILEVDHCDYESNPNDLDHVLFQVDQLLAEPIKASF